MADAHHGILRVVDAQAMSDLLGTPCDRPTPVLTKNGAALLPYDMRADESDALRVGDLAGLTFFDILAQHGVPGQLALSWSLGSALRVPLGGAGSIIETAAASGCVASDFPRDRTG